MKSAFKTLLAVTVVLAAVVAIQAEDKKDEAKTYKGTFGCAKCVFKLDGYKACANAIKVKEKDKDVYYVLQDGGKKEKYHGAICTSEKEGSVTGTYIKPAKEGAYAKIKPSKDGVKYD